MMEVDRVEVGHPAAPRIRLAFEVHDAAGTTRTLVEAGAELIAGPVETPWRSLNARLDAPPGLRITIFEELESLESAPPDRASGSQTGPTADAASEPCAPATPPGSAD